MKKRKMFYLVAVLLTMSVGMFFFIIRGESYPKSENDQTNKKGSLLHLDMPILNMPMLDMTMMDTSGGDYLKSDVNWGGGSLPHPGNNEGNFPEPKPEHTHEGSENNEDNDSGYSGQPKPDGTPYPGLLNVVWAGNGNIRPEDGYTWKNPNDPKAGKYRVVPLPRGTPYRDYLHVVWSGDGQSVMAVKGYKWDTSTADIYDVVPLPLGTPYAGHPNVVWSGDGEQFRPAKDYKWEISTADIYDVVPLTIEEKIMVYGWDALRTVKDKRMWDWMINVDFIVRDDPGQKKQLSPWMGDGCLVYTETFLTETKATQENLIVFESGKLFFTMMKDKPVKDGKTLGRWFADYVGSHNSTILDMREAKSKDQNEDLSMIIDFPDYPSKFGYIFRAQALQLDKPNDEKAQQEWDEVIREFQTYVYPLLQGGQEK